MGGQIKRPFLNLRVYSTNKIICISKQEIHDQVTEKSAVSVEKPGRRLNKLSDRIFRCS